MKYSQSSFAQQTRDTEHYLADITKARIAHWLRHSNAVAASGDNRFADDGETLRMVSQKIPLKPAAVLVLLVGESICGQLTPNIVFTQRTAHLTDHAGQISFPGGRVEETDHDAVATALREAQEETGIDPARIDVLGALPAYTTGTGYLITPIVAWAATRPQYMPDPSEVEEIFEVPAAYLLDAATHRHEHAMYKGRMREYYAIPYEKRYIWGATAGMLITFAEVAAYAEGITLAAPHLMTLDSA